MNSIFLFLLFTSWHPNEIIVWIKKKTKIGNGNLSTAAVVDSVQRIEIESDVLQGMNEV